jgi:hypothetical protein
MIAWCNLVSRVQPHAALLIATAFDPEEATAVELNASLARVQMSLICIEEVMLPAFHKMSQSTKGFRSYFGIGGKPADPMQQVIQRMSVVMRVVQEQDPFAVDSIFLLFAKLNEATSALLRN